MSSNTTNVNTQNVKEADESMDKPLNNENEENIKPSENDKRAEEKKKAEEKREADKRKTEGKKRAEKKKKAEAKKKAEEKKKADAKRAADKKKADEAKKSEKKKGLSIKTISGMLFAKMMKGGASELRAHVDKVNKLNVFPVPDGDTGDNMSMTIESGVAALESVESDDLALVMKVASKGMLLGARGNSGVILSQFFAGIAKALESADDADAYAMADALQAGVDRAYASVVTPTEGTILTVARESVDYARKRLTPKSTIRTLFADLVKEMYDAVDRTPERLAVLKEAGVVDSGGAGLFYIIDGLNRVLGGEEPADAPKSEKKSAPENDATVAFGPDSEMIYGYCTEVLLQLQNSKCNPDEFDLDALKSYLGELGDSIVAFKTDSIVKLHVHTLTPEKVLEYGRRFGEFISVKIENMSLQHTSLEKGAQKQDADEKTEEKPAPVSQKTKTNGFVAVSSGSGISDIFTELGTDVIVEGGQTNNPSTQDFLDAFDKVAAENIFVLPNNSNIVMAASQAAEIYTRSKVYVIPAKTIGAGYVALSSIDPESQSPEEILAASEEAISRINSAYISPSVRDTDMNGIHVSEGDTIGVINKDLVVSMPDRAEATKELISKLLSGGDKFMLTVFTGADAPEDECVLMESYVKESFPEVECYFLVGNQEIYPYIFVAE
ncbi:MAG: DAK2 domain-containing protein [Clostridia bacterium]|nr:DAK2 domain-containing protein [Clostridia bacterium]